MTVLNKHHGNIPADAVYIGRGSKWGNPFKIGEHGTRAQVINYYHNYIYAKVEASEFTLKDLAELHGKDLVCFCAPAPCHGDVLTVLALWAHEALIEQEKIA